MRPPLKENRPKPANKRAVARLAAVQALYQMDVTGSGARDIVKEFELFRLKQGGLDGDELRAIDMNWFDGIVTGVVSHQRRVDSAIDEVLKEGWPLRRIDLTLRALLRASLDRTVDRPPAVGSGPNLKPGSTGPRVAVRRARLGARA